MTDSDKPRGVLDRATLVPLGLVAVMVLAISGGVVWLNDRLLRIENGIAMLAKDVETGAKNRWTSNEMKMWARLLAAENPDLKVPLPDTGYP